jgi:hypothetical protein
MKIVIAASIAATPQQAGWTCAVLQYVLGFRQLGHQVVLIDPIDAEMLRPGGTALAASQNAKYFTQFTRDRALAGASALFVNGTCETIGLDRERLRREIRESDVLFNLSGKLRDRDLIALARRAVYVDVDPAFTQLWHMQGCDVGLDGHTWFVTIGQNLERAPGIPTVGKRWIATMPPVVLDEWPITAQLRWNALTTIANWRGYGSIEHDGIRLGQKAHTLRALMALPRKTSERFVLALAIDPGERRDLAALREHGWCVIDPLSVCSTPEDYRAFIAGSKAEFGFAKSGYVASQCGWFSDRSVCYLASGRPVIAQDTGFTAYLPTGAGLFSFTTDDDVLRSIDALNSDYKRHARSARELAAEYFDSRRVLTRLLSCVGAA